jgi:hypothetical protein
MENGILNMFDMKRMIDILKQRQEMISYKMDRVDTFQAYNELANEWNHNQKHIDYLKEEIIKCVK